MMFEKSPFLSVPAKSGEKVRQVLLDMGLLNIDLKIISEQGRLYLPLTQAIDIQQVFSEISSDEFIVGHRDFAITHNTPKSLTEIFQGTMTEEELAREIFQAFVKNKQTKRRMALALLKRFEDSYSFVNAKDNMSLLEEIDYWEPQFEERIRRAIESNDQISKSWGVPRRAESLIRNWAR